MKISWSRAMLIVPVLALALAGCGSHGSGSPAARAAASSLAASPAVAKWKPVVAKCAGRQHWIAHPASAGKATIDCAGKDLTPAQRKKAGSCLEKAVLRNGLHDALARDEESGAECLAAVSPG